MNLKFGRYHADPHWFLVAGTPIEALKHEALDCQDPLESRAEHANL
jgi:hypothetical protein